jgi:predicted O-methyltransferase YrrM
MEKVMKTVTTFIGKKQFVDYYTQLEKELTSKDFYYAFAFQSEYQSKEVRQTLKEFHARIAKKNVDDRAIFSTRIKEIVLQTYKDNKNIRLRFKDVPIPVGFVITKDRILQLGWRPQPFITEIKNNILFKHYFEFFLENWNKNESIEFAREVFRRFSVPFNEEVIRKINNLRDNKSAQEVADSIEKIEETWQYQYKGKQRKYGQKVVGETIKLWSVPRTTAEFLEFFVAATKCKKILEIGTSAGYSTLYLAMGATYTKGTVYTIERLPAKIKLAQRNFKKSKLKNIKLLTGDAQQLLRAYGFKDVDLIFLDADKENYGKYFDLFMPFLKKGGFIIADNIFDYGHMMTSYLNKVLGTKLPHSQSDPRVRSYTLPIDNGVLITRKIKD